MCPGQHPFVRAALAENAPESGSDDANVLHVGCGLAGQRPCRHEQGRHDDPSPRHALAQEPPIGKSNRRQRGQLDKAIAPLEFGRYNDYA